MTSRAKLARYAVAAAAGVALGVGAYTFVYARGYSYLGHNPSACANCHVMNSQFAGWQVASHRQAAVCNDCHAPGGLVAKYWVKARNGFWHSFYFTTGSFREPIQMTAGNRAVTEQRCRDCHAAVVNTLFGAEHRPAVREASSPAVPDQPSRDGISCIRCHRNVGHL